MKLYPECCACMLGRVLMFCSGQDEKTKYRVMKEVCRVFAENFSKDVTTTELAYLRNKAIEELIMDRDPMKELKDKSFRAAEKLYPKLEKYMEKISDDKVEGNADDNVGDNADDKVEGNADDKTNGKERFKVAKERFKAALKIALAGNIVEFGARDHKPDLNSLEGDVFEIVEGDLAIDDTDRIYEMVKNSGEILYVTDNTAELIFDKIFIRELQRYATVIVAPLSVPVQDDASVAEAKRAGLDKMCDLIPRGDSIGIWFEKSTPEFLKKYDEVDLVIAKGMGCYETLVEYPEKTDGRVALLMKAKCVPVARDIGVELGGNVVKIM